MDGKITVGSATVSPGETASLKLTISDNPGIMAMTISIKYDSEILEYVKYALGILRSYILSNHPDKNLVRFASCDPRENNTVNGVMLTLSFKVKEDTLPGTYPITIEYGYGDFCQKDLTVIYPEIIAGGITVISNGGN